MPIKKKESDNSVNINSMGFIAFKKQKEQEEKERKQLLASMPKYMNNMGNDLFRYKVEYLRYLNLYLMTFNNMTNVHSVDMTRIRGSYNHSEHMNRYFTDSENLDKYEDIANYLKKYITTIESFLKNNPTGIDFSTTIENIFIDQQIKQAERERNNL